MYCRCRVHCENATERAGKERNGSGEPLPNGGLAEETLILKIGEPCLGKGLQLGLQARRDVGFLAGIVIAIYFLKSKKESHYF